MTKKIFLNLLFLVSLSLTSCAAQTSTIRTLTTVKKSFVKIESLVRLVNEDCDDEKEACTIYPWVEYASGSGAVILYHNSKVILTAAHVCKPDAFGFSHPEGKVEIKLLAIDRENKKHVSSVIKYDKNLDVCLLSSGTVDSSALSLSMKKPEYGEKVYNLAAPLGIVGGEMVPVLEGRYFGDRTQTKAMYGIPTIGGSSGSPIVNIKGELIGMIHSVHYRFHHMAVSVSYTSLWNFLMPERSHTSILQNLSLHLDSLPNLLEGFQGPDQKDEEDPEINQPPPLQKPSEEED